MPDAVEATPPHYQVLGPVRAHRAGDELALGPAKQLTVLAVLLLGENQLQSREEIIGAVWGEQPPAGAAGLVATYVARLRKVIEPERPRRSPAVSLVSRGTSYGLFLDRDQVDLRVFDDLRTRAGQAREAGDLPGCTTVLDQALGLWHGSALEGLRGPYAEVHRARLGELRLAAQECRCEVALDQGLHHEVVGELSALATAYPLRERVRELLMLALHRAGRRAEALAVFHDAWRTLVDTSGIEPGPELRRMQRRILDSDPGLDLGRAGRPVVVRERPAQLPPDIADFTGRAAELAAIRELAGVPGETGPSADGQADADTDTGMAGAPARSAVPVVLITGPGGVGKTTLAVHAAHQLRDHFPDGQLHLQLHGMHDRPRLPAEVLERILADLGVPPERVSTDIEQRTALYRTVTSGRRLLILLDDARDAAQLEPLLPGSPDCMVLVTSRARLSDLPVERTLDLAGMDDAEALGLLRKIVGPALVEAEPDAAAQLVQICSGLPLALRVVGARSGGRPAGSLRRVAARLVDQEYRLGELRAGEIGVRASFQVGYDNLVGTPGGMEAARAFRLLSRMRTPDLELAAAATALDLPRDRAEDILEALADVHLLQTGHTQGRLRYRFHHLLQLFGRELSRATDPEAELTAALARMMRALVAVVDQAYELLRPGHQLGELPEGPDPRVPAPCFGDAAAAVRWLEAERAGVVGIALQASEHGAASPDELAELTTRLRAFMQRRGYWKDWELLAATTIASAGTDDRWTRAAAIGHLELGTLATVRHHFEHAFSQLRLSIDLFAAAGDPLGRTRALNNLGMAYIAAGHYQEAGDCLDQALAVQRAAHRPLDVSITLDNLGLLHLRRGAVEQAAAYCAESLAFHRSSGAAELASAPLNILGLVRCEQGRFDEAIACQRESRSLARAQGNLYREAFALLDLADAYRRKGDVRRAVDCAEQGLEIRRRLGDPFGTGQAFARLGAALEAAEQRDRAQACWREAAAAFDALAPAEATAIRARLAARR